MKYHILLLEDVVNHGRKGQLVYAAPGYARNYLLPRGKALLASQSTVRMQEKLQSERQEQSARDRSESLDLAEKLKGKMFETVVKVDPDGHMYGSVTTAEISQILQSEGYMIDKKSVLLLHPIRAIGSYQVRLMLPEQVEASIGLEVKPDRKIEKKKAAPLKEEQSQEEASEAKAEDGETPKSL